MELSSRGFYDFNTEGHGFRNDKVLELLNDPDYLDAFCNILDAMCIEALVQNDPTYSSFMKERDINPTPIPDITNINEDRTKNLCQTEFFPQSVDKLDLSSSSLFMNDNGRINEREALGLLSIENNNDSAYISSNDGNSGSTGTNDNTFDYLPDANQKDKSSMSSSSSRQKRLRTSFKHQQLRIMKSYFEINHNPDAKDLRNLSQKTGLPKRVLQVWFQNARAKHRRLVADGGDSPLPNNSNLVGINYDNPTRDLNSNEADNFSILSSIQSPCTESENKPINCMNMPQSINFNPEMGLDFSNKLLHFDSSELNELFRQ